MEYKSINSQTYDIGSAIQHLYKNGMYTDTSVFYNARKEHFRVHKLILAIQSPVLSDMLFGNNRCNEIAIDCIDAEAVRNIISYFYDEEPVLESIFHIKETKKIAEKFQVVNLINICKEKLYDLALEVSNVVSILEAAMEFGNLAKETECLALISENKETVFTSESFLEMDFKDVLTIFDKLRDMDSLTEAGFLLSSLNWLENKKSDSYKDMLMEMVNVSKLSMDEFHDIIISFPEFFSNIEISRALKDIKSAISQCPSKVQEGKTQSRGSDELSDAESEVSNEIKGADAAVNEESLPAVDDQSEEPSIPLYSSIVSLLAVDGPTEEPNISLSSGTMKDESAKKKTQLIILIFPSNKLNNLKKARLTIVDEVASRSLQFEIAGKFNQGLLKFLSNENGRHVYDDVPISYEGIYYMISCLKAKTLTSRTLSPINYIETFRAAVYFELEEVTDFCLRKLQVITDYDPVFLDELRTFSEARCLHLLTSQPLTQLFLHPNFINCSFELISLLLKQNPLIINNESLLLVAVIVWLETRNRLRWNHRESILNEIAFENISCDHFQQVVKNYPNFFTNYEVNSILSYRNDIANMASNILNLPNWYNFKSRIVVDLNKERE